MAEARIRFTEEESEAPAETVCVLQRSIYHISGGISDAQMANSTMPMSDPVIGFLLIAVPLFALLRRDDVRAITAVL